MILLGTFSRQIIFLFGKKISCKFRQFALLFGAEDYTPTQMGTTALESGSLVMHTTASREKLAVFLFRPERLSQRKLKTKELTVFVPFGTLRPVWGRRVRFFPGEYAGSYNVVCMS